MTTRDEFIEYLLTLPDEVIISVLEQYDCSYSTCVREVILDIDPIKGNIDYTDLTGNPFVNEEHPNYNKKFLVLGNK